MQPGSFDQIYQDYFDSVYRYALSLSGNPQAAEEIAQETFFKAMRTLDQFQGKSSLKSWLCAIAKNLWLSEQRIRKDQPIDDALPLQDPSIGPEEAIVRQDESMRIHRLLHHLDEPYREVFTLRTLNDFCHDDFFRSAADVVHFATPFKRILCLQAFSDTFLRSHLRDQVVQHPCRPFICIRQVSVQGAIQDKLLIQSRMLRLQVFHMHLAPPADGAMFSFAENQVWIVHAIRSERVSAAKFLK